MQRSCGRQESRTNRGTERLLWWENVLGNEGQTGGQGLDHAGPMAVLGMWVFIPRVEESC